MPWGVQRIWAGSLWPHPGHVGCLDDRAPPPCPCLQVVAHDPECKEYAVVHFGPTLFTEAALDIMSRTRGGITEERRAAIIQSLDPEMRSFAEANKLRKTVMSPST